MLENNRDKLSPPGLVSSYYLKMQTALSKSNCFCMNVSCNGTLVFVASIQAYPLYNSPSVGMTAAQPDFNFQNVRPIVILLELQRF
jgi:hypothetical protein